MLNKTLKVIIAISITVVALNAYDVEKEGNYWYVYDGNDVVGTYSKVSGFSKYSISCGRPDVSSYKTKYVDTRVSNPWYKTKREARQSVIKYCKRR